MGSRFAKYTDLEPAPDVAGSMLTPMNEEGNPFRYCMGMPDGEDILYADGYPDMLEGLLPGYLATEDEVERAVMRIQLGAQVATVMQAEVLANTDPAAISETEWKVLTAPRVGSTCVRADWWTSPIPLIVVETSYVPYTEIPRPASGLSDGVAADNLFWVRPAEEEDFLLSLHEVGFIRLMENMDIDPALKN